ncbi:hypothetical protein M0R45_008746 [Rubus argutus]|uniref:Disease resistance N-terminal domain-containing protein n=1 Tax=Rubus argutus TaxID=59490 RepID=A0AAW1Y5Y2_RUBAR
MADALISFVIDQDAEKSRVKEAVVQDWLDKLKGVSYEMDNVLDEWNTQALKQQIGKQENEGESALVNKKKVRFSIPSPSNCFFFGQASHRIVVRHDLAQTIKQLNIKLTSIAEERHKYEFQSTTTSGIEETQRPKTSLWSMYLRYLVGNSEKLNFDKYVVGFTVQER